VEHWLALDLSTATGTLSVHRVAPASPPELILENRVGEALQHSEKFLETLQQSLEKAGLRLDQLSRYLTPSGPGSFTGLRIAMASLKAFALALNRPIETVSSSEARALAWRAENPTEQRAPLVLTHVSLDKYVHSRWQGAESVEVGLTLTAEEKSGTVVLLDDRAAKNLGKPEGVASAHYPLRASHLAVALPDAKSRKTYATLAEWIALAPQYFGETRF
jgi:tRNA threonylcarbamoyl adenosine modification protein YeaZ